MISLGEIARLAGVRSHLEAPQKATSGQSIAEYPNKAVSGPPKLVEPQPIAPVQLNTEKAAERSASATDLYNRAFRDSDRQAIDLNSKGPSPAREARLNLTRFAFLQLQLIARHQLRLKQFEHRRKRKAMQCRTEGTRTVCRCWRRAISYLFLYQ